MIRAIRALTRERAGLDFAFEAVGNAEIARVHWDVTERIRIIRRLDFTKLRRVEATYEEHAQIIRALTRRRADEAQRLIRAHIEQSKLEVRHITLSAGQLAAAGAAIFAMTPAGIAVGRKVCVRTQPTLISPVASNSSPVAVMRHAV